MSPRQSLLVTLANRTFDGLDLQQLASRLELAVVRLTGDSVADVFNSEQVTDAPSLYVGTGDYNFDAQLAAAIGVPVVLAAGDEAAAGLAQARIEEVGATVASVSTGDLGDLQVADVGARRVMSPVVFERQLIEQAKANRKHVVLPEGEDDRILQARETMKDVSYFGTMMVHKGLADGMVSGAAHTTAHTIKPSFQIIKTAPGTSVVSSIFLLVMQDRLWAFGDCAVNPNPTAEQLGEIAAVSARTAQQFGIDPKVAILSYSTGTSGSGPDVDRAVAAVEAARQADPELVVDGPLQFDAACDPGVGKKKAPDSPVAGQANVFIFPDLEAGNAGYKIAQRTGGALAVGPVLQGLNKPVNDLSRGATVPDIVNTVAITAIQAGAK